MCRKKKSALTNHYLSQKKKEYTIAKCLPDWSACFCLNLFRTSVASNPALSHNCRGITYIIEEKHNYLFVIAEYNKLPTKEIIHKSSVRNPCVPMKGKTVVAILQVYKRIQRFLKPRHHVPTVLTKKTVAIWARILGLILLHMYIRVLIPIGQGWLDKFFTPRRSVSLILLILFFKTNTIQRQLNLIPINLLLINYTNSFTGYVFPHPKHQSSWETILSQTFPIPPPLLFLRSPPLLFPLFSLLVIFLSNFFMQWETKTVRYTKQNIYEDKKVHVQRSTDFVSLSISSQNKFKIV